MTVKGSCHCGATQFTVTRLVHLDAKDDVVHRIDDPLRHRRTEARHYMSRNGIRRSSRRRGGTVLDRRATIRRVTAFRRTR
jgi:hypothetical protein